ncbi:MAG TPA: hypothetical protein VF737_12270 [Gemmatimonadaceae bacterium]
MNPSRRPTADPSARESLIDRGADHADSSIAESSNARSDSQRGGNMRGTRIISLATLAAIVALSPVPGRAQLAGRIVVTPYVGAYVPTADLGRLTETSGGLTATAAVKQLTAGAAGMNVSYWLNSRFAIEAGALYSSSKAEARFAATGAPTSKLTDYANVWLGSAKLMMHLLPSTSRFNIRLGVGPAIISRNGSSYRSDATSVVSGLTDVGGVVSLCTRIPVNDVLGLRVRAEDYMYSAKIGATTTDPSQSVAFASRMQHDLVFSIGMQLFATP